MPFRAFLIALFALAFVACEKPEDDTPADDFDRGALLTNWADGIILPAYETWAEDVSALESALLDLDSEAGEIALAGAREALQRARTSWQTVAYFDFGPAASQALSAVTNIYPLDTEQVLENLSAEEVNLEIPANLAAGGFEALDYLLYGTGATDAEVLAFLTAEASAIPYAQQIGGLLAAKSQAVYDAWSPASGNYRATFVNATGTDVGSGLGLMLNAFNRVYEADVRKNKLGLPSGAMTFSMTPLPDHVEGAYSHVASNDYLLAALDACDRIYNGINAEGFDGVGLDDYLHTLGANHLDAPLNLAIQEQWQAATDAVEALPAPLAATVVSDQQACLDAYGELQQMVVLYKVDMMSCLGVLITYQDNDGD